MVKATFVSQSSRLGDDIGYSPERVVNMYAEAGPQGAKGPLLLRSVLGRTVFAETGLPVARAMEFIDNKIWIVSGGALFSLNSGGTITNKGVVGDSAVSTLAGNSGYITVCANDEYSVLDTDGVTLTTPGSGRFSAEGTLATFDHYTVLTEADGDEFEWTTLTDPTTRNSTYFATNESHNDKTLRVMQDGSYMVFFGEESTEIWYNTNESGADAFLRVGGGVLNTGILAANLAAKTENGLFFVGDDKIVYLMSGGRQQAVSTPAVNQTLDTLTPTHCFYYEDRGHRFCVVRFAGRPAWVYDMTTGLWHERSSGVLTGAWDVIDAVRAWGSWYCINTEGVVYAMSRNNTDTTSALLRSLTSSAVYMGGNYFSVDSLELLGEFGESATDATIVLRLSKDGGRTFGAPIYLDAGKVGERLTRVLKRACGSYRDFSFRIEMSEATDMNIYSDINLEVS